MLREAGYAVNAAEMLAAAMAPRSKYHARGFRDPQGTWWDSRAEYLFWLNLHDRQKRGEITNLVVKPVFTVVPAFTDWQGKRHKATRYESDFQYNDTSGKTWVADVKGMVTRDYRIKRELFLWLNPEYCFVEIDPRTLAPRATR